MNPYQKIQKQIHTSSILICQNDNTHPFKSATWIRKTENQIKILKKQLFQNKSQSVYHCTLFDFNSCIILELQTGQGYKKEFQYGPIKLDQKILTMLENQVGRVDSFQVTVLLNKNQQYPGIITFSKKQPESFTLHITIATIQITLQYSKYQFWSNYEQILNINNPKSKYNASIFINLLSNIQKFRQNLKKIRLYCHFGNHLIVVFREDDLRNLFLAKFLDAIVLGNKIKECVGGRARIGSGSAVEGRISGLNINTPGSYLQTDINNLFASQDQFFGQRTPQISQNVLQDFRNIVFTPKPTFQKDIRQRAFTNFENFLTSQTKPIPKIPQNLPTTQTIKQQSIEQQSQSKKKTRISSPNQSNANNKTKKSHQFIFAYNRNNNNQANNNNRLKKQRETWNMNNNLSKKCSYQNLNILQNQVQSQKFLSSTASMPPKQTQMISTESGKFSPHKKYDSQFQTQNQKQGKRYEIESKLLNTVSTKSISYQELIERNKNLQDMNRKLIQQNIKLKQRLKLFISFKKFASKSKEKEKSKDKQKSKQRGQNSNYNLPEFIKVRRNQKKNQQQKSNQAFSPNAYSNYNYFNSNTTTNYNISYNSPPTPSTANPNQPVILNRHSNSHLYGNLQNNSNFSSSPQYHKNAFGRASQQLYDYRNWHQPQPIRTVRVIENKFQRTQRSGTNERKSSNSNSKRYTIKGGQALHKMPGGAYISNANNNLNAFNNNLNAFRYFKTST